MTDLHGIIVSLTRREPSPKMRYGATLLLIAALTLVRSFSPAFIAPFLFYIPALLLVSLAFRWTAGTLALVLSDGIAGGFYARDGVLVLQPGMRVV